MSDELTIDKEFLAVCDPLLPEELELLEQQILVDGCTDPIILWANHDDTILDGMHRYQICQKHGLSFKTKALKIETREEAVAWIAAKQLGRRNVSDGRRAMLAARLIKSTHGGDRKSQKSKANGHENQVVETQLDRKKAAQLAGVSVNRIDDASKVISHGSKALQEAVRADAVPLTNAAVISELPKSEQAKLVAKGPEAVAAKAKKLKASDKPKQYNDDFDPSTFKNPRPGSEKKTQFKDSVLDDLFGKVIRAIDDRWNAKGGHGNKYRICLNKVRDAFDAWKEWKRA